MKIANNIGQTMALADAATPAEIVAVFRCTEALMLCTQGLLNDAQEGEAYETLIKRIAYLHEDQTHLVALIKPLMTEVH